MKVLAIIPARYNSSRFPGKPLIDIMGKSMIQRVYEQTVKAGLVNHTIVATDDQRIYDHVKNFGGEVMMTSTEHRSGTERCGEVAARYDHIDVVINIQGDEPLIDPGQIDKVLQSFKIQGVEIATMFKTMTDLEEVFNPNRVKVILDHQQNAIYFSRHPIPFIANKPKEEWLNYNTYRKHIGIYAWRRETLNKLLTYSATDLEKQESLEQLRWLYYGHSIKVVETKIETPNIDTPDDLHQVLSILKAE